MRAQAVQAHTAGLATAFGTPVQPRVIPEPEACTTLATTHYTLPLVTEGGSSKALQNEWVLILIKEKRKGSSWEDVRSNKFVRRWFMSPCLSSQSCIM